MMTIKKNMHNNRFIKKEKMELVDYRENKTFKHYFHALKIQT